MLRPECKVYAMMSAWGKTRIAEQRTIDKGSSMVWSLSVDKVFRWFGPVHWGEAKTRAYAHGDQNPNQGRSSSRENLRLH